MSITASNANKEPSSAFKLPLMIIWSNLATPAPAPQMRVNLRRRRSSIISIEPYVARESIILYLHGGAYVTGGFRSHGGFACELGCRSGQKVCFVEYRLAPEYPAPTAVEDAMYAFEWLTNDRGYKPENVTLAGDSAGGALCLLLMLKLKKLGKPMPGGAYLMSPWTDMSASQPSFVSNADKDILLGNEPQILLWALGKSNMSDLSLEMLQSEDVSPLYAKDLTGSPFTSSTRTKRSETDLLAFYTQDFHH
jgi:acetyl esterase/lipase